MITLANLNKATAQEVFDQVKNHLLQQNERASTNLSGQATGCKYRIGNLKCAAGCLIADNEYNPDFEKKDWTTLADAGLVPSKHKMLIGNLQTIHDCYNVEDWKEELQKIAKLHNLIWN